MTELKWIDPKVLKPTDSHWVMGAYGKCISVLQYFSRMERHWFATDGKPMEEPDFWMRFPDPPERPCPPVLPGPTRSFETWWAEQAEGCVETRKRICGTPVSKPQAAVIWNSAVYASQKPDYVP